MTDRIIIFGGTFDPPHRAHVELPALVRRAVAADRVVFVPAALSPLKGHAPPTAAHHRLAMLRLALADEPHAEISTIELDRTGPSYTVDTLRALRETHGAGAELLLLIGADQALDFSRWKDWQTILELATVVVMLRPPNDREAFAASLRDRYDEPRVAEWLSRVIKVPLIDVGSTGTRALLRAGADPPGVASTVMAYIREHGLYRE